MDTSQVWEKQGSDWGSHLPALMACIAASEGPVLEIGAGHFSTPCLHALCSTLKRQLVTTEVEDLWRMEFMNYANDWHQIMRQTEEKLQQLSQQQWGVVFVDDLASTRANRAELFYDSAQFMVFHDYNFPQFRPELDAWIAGKNCKTYVYKQYAPHTLIVSKNTDIPNFAP